jgi:hypothetical protein
MDPLLTRNYRRTTRLLLPATCWSCGPSFGCPSFGYDDPYYPGWYGYGPRLGYRGYGAGFGLGVGAGVGAGAALRGAYPRHPHHHHGRLRHRR